MKKGIRLLSTGFMATSLLVGGMFTSSAQAATTTAKQGAAVNIPNQEQVINNIIQSGKNLIGKARYNHTYRPPYSLDCSSFTYYIFGKNGINLKTKDDDKQYDYGKYVPKSQLKKGDLVFFSTKKNKRDITHVGVYIGNGKLLHMASPRTNVTIANLNGSWYQKNYVTAKRIVQ